MVQMQNKRISYLLKHQLIGLVIAILTRQVAGTAWLM
jgi:hypothetical protein